MKMFFYKKTSLHIPARATSFYKKDFNKNSRIVTFANSILTLNNNLLHLCFTAGALYLLNSRYNIFFLFPLKEGLNIGIF